jgi:hypothetical protein
MIALASLSCYSGGNHENREDDEFYRNITEGRCENPTVKRAVDGHLTAILGREAAYRQGRLTMDELLKENKRLELNLSGLKS